MLADLGEQAAIDTRAMAGTKKLLIFATGYSNMNADDK
jgi:hypothetical protein